MLIAQLLISDRAKISTCIILFNPDKSIFEMDRQRHRMVKYLKATQLVSGRAKRQPRALSLLSPVLIGIFWYIAFLQVTTPSAAKPE